MALSYLQSLMAKKKAMQDKELKQRQLRQSDIDENFPAQTLGKKAQVKKCASKSSVIGVPHGQNKTGCNKASRAKSLDVKPGSQKCKSAAEILNASFVEPDKISPTSNYSVDEDFETTSETSGEKLRLSETRDVTKVEVNPRSPQINPRLMSPHHQEDVPESTYDSEEAVVCEESVEMETDKVQQVDDEVNFQEEEIDNALASECLSGEMISSGTGEFNEETAVADFKGGDNEDSGFMARQEEYLRKLRERQGPVRKLNKAVAPTITKSRQQELQRKFEARNLERLKALAKKNQDEQELKRKEELKKARRREKLRRAVLAQQTARESADTPETGNLHLPVGSATTAVRAKVGRKVQRKSDEKQEESPEDLAEKKRRAKEAAERIRKRQQEHIRKVAERKLQQEKQQKVKDSNTGKLRARLKAEMLQLAAEVREKKRLDAEQKAAEDAEAAARAPPPIVLTAEERKANFNAFLDRVKDSQERREAKSGREETDETRWRKKNGVGDGQKVFVITGFYPSLKKFLLERGWFHNEDRESKFWDLKWTIASKHIDHRNLQPGQVVNHFSKASKIVTKVGLMTSLKCLSWFANAHQDHFFPRCYDLTKNGDRLDMMGDFYTVHALNILRNVLHATGISMPSPRPGSRAGCSDESAEVPGLGDSVKPDFAITSQGTEDVFCRLEVGTLRSCLTGCKRPAVNAGVLELALRVVEMRTQIFDDDYIDSGGAIDAESEDGLAISYSEWALLRNADIFSTSDPPAKPEVTEKAKKNVRRNKKKKKKVRAALIYDRVENISDDMLLRLLVALDAVRVAPSFQTAINGSPSKNVWIVKPAGKSRGRGIQCFSNLEEILKHTSTTVQGCAETQWVVQKYIENPLIIHKRKFDIRQWVLVTSFNPLRVYFYNDCYLRFCAHDYDLSDLNDKYIHLANNSISKKSKKFKESPFEGNMWHSDDFCEHLKAIHGDDALWHRKILPRMKQAVAWSLMSVQDMVNHREGSHELYGYDFMVDAEYNVWLIEVNSSPAMDYSTSITERLVKSVLPDTMKVILDAERATSKGKRRRKNVDTGRWELIYAAKRAVDHPMAMGADLAIQGQPLRRSRGTASSRGIVNIG